GFVLEAQVALIKLARRDQIVVDQPSVAESTLSRSVKEVKRVFEAATSSPKIANEAGAPKKVALQLIGEANRRWMSKTLLAFVLGVTSLIIVGTEYLPPMSDYKHV